MPSHSPMRGGAINRLKDLWRNGECAFGAIATIPSAQVVQIIAAGGLDWVMLDQLSGAIDMSTLHSMIAATAGTTLVPLVRATGPQLHSAGQALDLGALGICFTQITSRKDTDAAVHAVRYPPLGTRQRGGVYGAWRAGVSPQVYADCANDEVLAIGVIDHVRALGCIDEIASTPGLDALFVDIDNLVASMRPLVAPSHPTVAEALNLIEAAVIPRAVVLGGTALNPEHGQQMVQRGYRAVGIGYDWALLQQSLQNNLPNANAAREVRRMREA